MDQPFKNQRTYNWLPVVHTCSLSQNRSSDYDLFKVRICGIKHQNLFYFSTHLDITSLYDYLCIFYYN